MMRYFVRGSWLEGDEESILNREKDFCAHCKKSMNLDDPDICLGGYLPFTSHACCGHGSGTCDIVQPPYIVLSLEGPDADMEKVKHSITLWGRKAQIVQALLKPFAKKEK